MEDFTIKPSDTNPSYDAANWPLLLKNYDKLMVCFSLLTEVVKIFSRFEPVIIPQFPMVIPRSNVLYQSIFAMESLI